MLGQVRQGVTLANYEVTLVEVRAEVWEPGKPAPKPVTFQVAVPNACSLKNEGVHNLLRTMLVAIDLEATRAFYANKVGLTILNDTPGAVTFRFRSFTRFTLDAATPAGSVQTSVARSSGVAAGTSSV